ncbi:MAG: ferrous iron transport protein B [Bacteroidaceae bacterium]|nr:ferrous iron transport protein B [Bacteroidaceae bacterium]
MNLAQLNTGERGVVVKVKGHGGFRKRIVEMGFIKGKLVEVLLNAPLQDPVKYRVMGYEISLRRSEAEMIEIVSEAEARMTDEASLHFHEGIPVEETLKKVARSKRRTINVALVGNPNCGKTSLFNLASGAHAHVGNYSGVTVDASEGYFDFQGYHFRLIDLPGTYSLSAYSPEELYVRKYIIDETPDIILNVIDASNLERNLYLTTQLIDMNLRMVCALNMYDELKQSGNELDHFLLSKLFGVPMIPTVCKHGRGIEHLFHVIINLYEGVDFLNKKGEINPEVLEELIEWHQSIEPQIDPHLHEEHLEDFTRGVYPHGNVFRHIHINHGPELEKAIDLIYQALRSDEQIRHKYSLRFLSIKLLENDRDIQSFVRNLPNGKKVLELRDKLSVRIRTSLNEDSETAITNAKYGFIAGAMHETFVDHHNDHRQLTKVLDSIVTHRIWGYPIFFIFLWIMFQSTFSLGQYPMNWISSLVDLLAHFFDAQMADGPLKAMLVDGILGGVGGVIVFLPNILILYFFISLMEDSGYMARAAFIMDKIMHKMGLHGKSFIPLIMGFGCNVPAILATRMIESRRSRLITMLAVPFMSCSARLPIYLLLTGIFFPNSGGWVMLVLYTMGILLSIFTARMLGSWLIKKDEVPFVMELPPYRMPTLKAIGRHTWEKGYQYIRKIGGIILVASVLIWALNYYPRHDSYATPQEQQENSYLGRIGKGIEPVLTPLGMDWKMGIGLISGAGAKELVASTLCVLYANHSTVSEDVEARRNMDISMREEGVTALTAFSFLVFVLIYFPCIATLAAIKQESHSWRWPLFTLVYTTSMAWLVTFLVYNIGKIWL